MSYKNSVSSTVKRSKVNSNAPKDFRKFLKSDEGYVNEIFEHKKVKELRDLLAKKHEDSGEVFLINEGTYSQCEDEYCCMMIFRSHDGEINNLCPCCGEIIDEYHLEVETESYEGEIVEFGEFYADFEATLSCPNCDSVLKSTYEQVDFYFAENDSGESKITYFNDSPESGIYFNLDDMEQYHQLGPLAMYLGINFEASIDENQDCKEGYKRVRINLMYLPDRWLSQIDELLARHQ